jgi:hypothetical protein
MSEKIETEYLASLSEKERMGYEIAKNHLGSTFHLQKSNGFIAWKKSMEEQKSVILKENSLDPSITPLS